MSAVVSILPTSGESAATSVAWLVPRAPGLAIDQGSVCGFEIASEVSFSEGRGCGRQARHSVCEDSSVCCRRAIWGKSMVDCMSCSLGDPDLTNVPKDLARTGGTIIGRSYPRSGLGEGNRAMYATVHLEVSRKRALDGRLKNHWSWRGLRPSFRFSERSDDAVTGGDWVGGVICGLVAICDCNNISVCISSTY